MKAIEKISQELLDNLQSAYITNISLGDEDKNQVSGSDNTELARNFAFNFVVDGVNLGTVLITLNSNAKSLEVQFDHDMLKKAQAESPELQIKAKKAWFDFLRKMRKFTSTTPDMTFDIINLTQKNLRKDSDMYTVDELKEGKMSKLAGSAKSSYQRVGENRIIIRHIGPIDEEKMGSRTRNIKSIYIENPAGERFLVKENSLIGARILAHHLSAGGNLMDDFSNHLYTMIREMRDLRSFVMSSRNKVFESDDANIMVEAATEYYKTLRETVRSLSTGRGYSRYLESFEPEQTTEVMDTQGLKEKFIVRSFNEKFEAALPHIAKAYQKKIQEQNQLYSAAQDYIDGNKAFGLTEADVMLYKTLKFESGQALSKKVLEHISAMLSTTDQTVSKFASESAVKFSTITETPESQTWLHQDLAMNLVKGFVAEMNSLNEKPLNPYAIGMAQAMKSTGDEPPLKKSTIKKAHHIADVISKEQGMAEGSAEMDEPQTPPFEPSKSTFKKNNPNRTPRDSVKALAQRGIQTNTNKDTEPVKQGVAEGTEDLELYGLRIGHTVKANINGKIVQGDIIDIFPDTMKVELLLRGANAGKTVTVDVRDTESLNEQGVAEGWKEKVAGATLGAAAIAGIGAGINASPPTYVDGVRYEMALKTPEDAELTTDDKGRKVYVWTSKSSGIKSGGQRTHRLYRPAEQVKEQGVAEGQPKVKRDLTVRVVRRGGKPIGEIGIDQDASPGQGPYYVKLYDGSFDASGYDTTQEALEELRAAMGIGKSMAEDTPVATAMPSGATAPAQSQAQSAALATAQQQQQKREVQDQIKDKQVEIGQLQKALTTI